MPVTSRLGIDLPDLPDRANIETAFSSIGSVLDKAAITDHGPLSSRPVSTVASPGIKGRRYYAEDEEVEYLDIGTGWANTGSKGTISSGTFMRAAEESRTNAAFGVLSTADQIGSIVLPPNGLIKVLYQAMLRETVEGAAKAAIFIGSDQLKVQAQVGVTGADGAAGTGSAVRGPQEQQAASRNLNGAVGSRPLISFPGGLAMLSYGGGANGGLADDPATGVAQGVVTDGTGPGVGGMSGGAGGDGITFEVGRNPAVGGLTGYHVRQALDGGHVGGVCIIDNLPAGTYTISIRFACLGGGTLSVKNRRLRVTSEKY